MTRPICTLVLIATALCLPSLIMAGDSTRVAHWRLTARTHNKGFFTYGGRPGTDNAAFDVNFTYERPTWGFMVFKGFDLADHHTEFNFALVALFKTFKITPRLSITPYVGSFLEQQSGMADHGSDLVDITVIAYKINPHFTLEYQSLLSNLVLVPTWRDWVQRFRLSATFNHWDLMATTWHNPHAFENPGYVSSSISVAYNRVKVSDHMMVGASLTSLSVLSTTDELRVPADSRLAVTFIAQMIH